MSDNSGDDEYFGNDGDSPVQRANRDDDDEGDQELALRNEDEDDVVDPVQEPEEGEDKDDAGYGGDETYGGEAGENHDEIVDQEEDGMDEIQYTKDEENAYDEYVDDEDADHRIKRDKKKKDKRGGEVSRKNKKRRKNDGHEEAIEDPNAEEDEELADKKKKKSSKKKVEEVTQPEVDNLIDDMLEAYTDDITAYQRKEPAINKLRLLPKVDTALKRDSFQKMFLNTPSGLDALSKWLQKLPNGALPSLQIRKKLLDIILQLPVNEDHLRESEIGKVVYGMRNNANEDPDLKKTIKEIIDKWTRIITGANDYDQPIEDIRDRKKIDVSLDEYRQRSMSSLRRSIPKLTMKKSGYDFVKKPDVGVSSRGQRSQTTEGQCDKIIKDMKRKIKKDLR